MLVVTRVLYPDLVFGAIASSAVTHAQLELWEYFDIIRQAAEPGCSRHLERSIKAIDGILLNAPHLKRPLKTLFGLAELKHDDDFASVLAVSKIYTNPTISQYKTFHLQTPLGAWQAKNWDPAVGSDRFQEFCDTLAHPFSGKKPMENHLLPGGLEVPVTVLNYARWVKDVSAYIVG